MSNGRRRAETGKPNSADMPQVWQPWPQAIEPEGLAGARSLKADLIEKGLRPPGTIEFTRNLWSEIRLFAPLPAGSV